MSRLSPDDIEERSPVDPVDVVRSVLAESGSLARFMEVHYLASEPDLLAIMRALAGLTEEDRKILAELVRNAKGAVRLGTVAEDRVELTAGSAKDTGRSN
jgi:ABC-type uncharacterized transport system ATPase subunit